MRQHPRQLSKVCLMAAGKVIKNKSDMTKEELLSSLWKYTDVKRVTWVLVQWADGNLSCQTAA